MVGPTNSNANQPYFAFDGNDDTELLQNCDDAETSIAENQIAREKGENLKNTGTIKETEGTIKETEGENIHLVGKLQTGTSSTNTSNFYEMLGLSKSDQKKDFSLIVKNPNSIQQHVTLNNLEAKNWGKGGDKANQRELKEMQRMLGNFLKQIEDQSAQKNEHIEAWGHEDFHIGDPEKKHDYRQANFEHTIVRQEYAENHGTLEVDEQGLGHLYVENEELRNKILAEPFVLKDTRGNVHNFTADRIHVRTASHKEKMAAKLNTVATIDKKIVELTNQRDILLTKIEALQVKIEQAKAKEENRPHQPLNGRVTRDIPLETTGKIKKGHPKREGKEKENLLPHFAGVYAQVQLNVLDSKLRAHTRDVHAQQEEKQKNEHREIVKNKLAQRDIREKALREQEIKAEQIGKNAPTA